VPFEWGNRLCSGGGCWTSMGRLSAVACVSMEDWFYRGVAYPLFFEMADPDGGCCSRWSDSEKGQARNALVKLDMRNAIMANFTI